ncbi:MAG: hypothetical protein ACKO38_12220 [Planctomycetota bacterium]
MALSSGVERAKWPSHALNRYHLEGLSDAACLVVWDQTAGDWVIAQVAHHKIEAPLKYRFYREQAILVAASVRRTSSPSRQCATASSLLVRRTSSPSPH